MTWSFSENSFLEIEFWGKVLISLGFRHFDFPEIIAENGFGEMDRVFGRVLGNF